MRALIGREAYFYNCMETKEISRHAKFMILYVLYGHVIIYIQFMELPLSACSSLDKPLQNKIVKHYRLMVAIPAMNPI